MNKLLSVSALALSFCSVAAFADTWTGYVSDAHCGAKHSEVSEANTKCVNGCLKGGADPVFVSNGKVFKFDAASKDKAKDLAGKNVTVDGTASGDTITINSISEASK